MQRLTLLIAAAIGALALCSCGATGIHPGETAAAGGRLSAALTPAISINAAHAQLALSTTGDVTVLRATGLADTKALYGRVYYDPSQQHFDSSTQLAADPVLTLFIDQPTSGYVEFGAVVANFTTRHGLDGAVDLARLVFAAGPADLTRVVSTAPKLVPEDSVTLTGTIDANNIPTLNWTEGLTGDSNNNGEVEIADFTPLGIFFHAHPDPVAPGDSEARDCDFNKDGEVAISDITDMGKNYHATLEGYFILSGPTAAALADQEQLPRATLFPTPKRQDGQEKWTWTGPALTADTVFAVQPYDRGNTQRGNVSTTQLLQPTLTITYTNIKLTFTGAATWPANRKAANGDYIVLATENSVHNGLKDGKATGATEPFATESLQLQVTAEDVKKPGIPIDITASAYMGLSAGGGLAQVSLVTATRGQLIFLDRGVVTVQTFLPGDFTQSATLTFDVETIDSLAVTSTAGASPLSIIHGTPIPLKANGTFDFDSAVAGDEVTVDLTSFCNWGLFPGAANTGTFTLNSLSGALLTNKAHAADTAQVVAEFPNTDNVTLFDDRKRSSAPFIVNMT